MNQIPENDKLCASIISNVIARGEGESRTASSPKPVSSKYRNQVYALREKLFGSFILPTTITTNELESEESRSAAISTTTSLNQGTKSPNQAYELRKILFGLS